jgi:hypothetical protein
MNSLLAKSRQLSHRFRGIKATKYLFPEEYTQLSPNLILNDDALEIIDRRLIELLNEHCFPCFDPNYDYQLQKRERPYLGLEKIAIMPDPYSDYDCYYGGVGHSWLYVHMTIDEYLGSLGYDESIVDYVERTVNNDFSGHPLSILPDVLRYVLAITGNLWLDTHFESDNEYELTKLEVITLEEHYREALGLMSQLEFFDRWFEDNRAIAQKVIDVIFRKALADDSSTN